MTFTQQQIHAQKKGEACKDCLFYDRFRIRERGRYQSPVMFVGDFPSLSSPQGGAPFQDRAGSIVSMALRHMRREYDRLYPGNGAQRWNRVEPFCIYAIQCATDDKPLKKTYTQCYYYLSQCIATVKPKVIVTLGADATRSVYKGKIPKFDNVRGTFIRYRIPIDAKHSHTFQIYPTFSPKAVLAQTGLFEELMRDLKRVFAFVEAGAQETSLPVTFSEDVFKKHYRLPHTVEEVRLLCQEIIDYRTKEGEDPQRHLISVDTETTTVEAHDPNAKIIAISFAWTKLQACTIVLDHPNAWWTPEDLVEVKKHVVRVLACAKPKVLHNDKFDRQMIVHRYGWPLNNVVWDTMGVEHLLEEDKKGIYGLKDLTRSRLPEYAGYEDKVAEIRDTHGGLTRAQEGKRYLKAVSRYEDALRAYAIKNEVYEHAFAKYSKGLDAWQQKRLKEKEKAKKERRKMKKEAFGKKPRKPLKPRPPKSPDRHEPFDYTMIPMDKLELYAAIDADVTRQHVLHQNQRLRAEYLQDIRLYNSVKKTFKTAKPLPVKKLVSEHVVPTSKSLAQMEFTGFPVNLSYLNTLDKELADVIEKEEAWLFKAAGKKFVIGNPQEVTSILFYEGFHDEKEGRHIRVPISDDTKRTAKGAISADAASLLYIANEYGYEFPKRIISLRKAQKARAPFLTNVREHARFDGRMHPSFHLTGTATGRLSSSEENMQNIPKKLAGYNIKDVFVPPAGYTLIDTDAKGAEIRIFATYSHDEKLIQAINDGLDSHSYFTSRVFGLDYEEIEFLRNAKRDVLTAQQLERLDYISRKRTNCKRVVFGILYGATAYKIAETAGIPLKEAQNVIDLMFEMFPSIPQYIAATHQEVRLFRAVATLTGRKRRFPISELRMHESRCFRQAVNFKIQSTSSDIVLWVLNQIMPIVIEDMRGEFHATVHDSIVYSVPDAYVAQIPDLMYDYGTKKVQQQFPWMSVPFLWDVEAGRAYGSCENITDYLEKLSQAEPHHHDTSKENEREVEVITDQEILQEFATAG